MRGRAQRPHASPAAATRRAATAERLRFAELGAGGLIELEDGWADVVITTLVLCSVPRPEATLGEVRRLLRPGGELLFMEHIGAPPGSPTRRVQSLITPLWRRLADGCCLDRDTETTIRAAGFERVDAQPYETHPKSAPFFVRPHVIGRAIG